VVASTKIIIREVTPCSLVYRCPCFSGNLLPPYSRYRHRQWVLLKHTILIVTQEENFGLDCQWGRSLISWAKLWREKTEIFSNTDVSDVFLWFLFVRCSACNKPLEPDIMDHFTRWHTQQKILFLTEEFTRRQRTKLPFSPLYS
jgi:hypothetical protein